VSDYEAIELLEKMVSIPSPSGRERELALFLSRYLAERGFEVRIDQAGNLIGATGPAEGPTIMLLGHLDTIPGELPTRREGGKLYGRGAADAKAALAAMIQAARPRPGLPARVLVAGAVEEETPQSRGANHIGRTSYPDAVVVGEPAGWPKVVIGYKGKLDLRFQVTRPAMHSSIPVPRASEVATELWSDLVELLGSGGERQGGVFWQPLAALEEFHGGVAEASMTVSCRLPPRFDEKALLAALHHRSRGACIELLNMIEAVVVEDSSPVVRALRAGVRAQGGAPVHALKTGTSDMNTVVAYWNVPIASYGPGESILGHTDEEHVDLDDYLRSIAVLATALEELAGELAGAARAPGEQTAPPPTAGQPSGDGIVTKGGRRA